MRPYPKENTYRLVEFHGCWQCPHLVPPQWPGDRHYCRMVYWHLEPNAPLDWVFACCPLPSPDDSSRRYRHIRGCMDCPHCEDRPEEPELDNHCALTGQDYPSPWYYDEDYDTDMLDDFWTLPNCPLPATTDPPSSGIGWDCF